MKSFLTLLAWITVIALGVGGLLLATCMRTWMVPSDDPLLALSVMPTLEAGDVVLLWRAGSPAYGEVVRCPDPEAPGRFIIGRILGEQGDNIVAALGSVTVNDKRIATRRACNPSISSVFDPTTGESVDLSV